MGVSDIIPGVSGGTIAFIFGIYERLINTIKSFNFDLLVSFFKFVFRGKFSEFREDLKKIDLGFLIPLGFGILIAFAIGSRIIPHLLENYPAYTFAFFFGLILASVKLIHMKSKRIKLNKLFFGLVGFFIAFLIAGLKELMVSHSYSIIFFSGFIAIAAMLLPGISGSFILLLLGQYKFMLEVLKNVELDYIFIFLSGAIIGLLSFSRLLSFLLKRYHSCTLWFLIGLMLGALRIPFENIVYVQKIYPDLGFVWNLFSVSLVVILFLVGMIFVLLIGKLNRIRTL